MRTENRPHHHLLGLERAQADGHTRRRYTAITAGWGHSCALGTNGSITCWGNNASGQTDAPNGQYSAVTAGWGHSCALDASGTITCWGDLNDPDAPS